jgi:RRXRR protein
MPILTNETKPLTRQDGSAPSAESTARGRANDMRGAPLASLPSVDQRRSGVHTAARQPYRIFVPVVDRNGKPLMPTIPSRARRWIKSREATPFFRRGIFCVRLNRDPSAQERQQIAVGIDPGSKREGFTVKSAAHTYLNIQADAVQYVQEVVATRRALRRNRRRRKTPYRAHRPNRAGTRLTPGIRARWHWKLRIVCELAKVFSVTDIVVEDIKARTFKGRKRWNAIFSRLEYGKTWFYAELERFGKVHLKLGWETKGLRDAVGLKKTKSKLSDVFEAHCVDSWVLANWFVGGHVLPDNTDILQIAQIRLHRRQLHALQPAIGGVRRPYGGTRSCGLKRGALVVHPKWGLAYVGGTRQGRVSLHSIRLGRNEGDGRLTRIARPEDIVIKAYNTWRRRFIPSVLNRTRKSVYTHGQ